MRKERCLIDCGFHHGEGLRTLMKLLNIPSEWRMQQGHLLNDWNIAVIEPNPNCQLQKRLFEMFTPPNQPSIFEKAVWVEEGKAQFAPENHFKSGSGSPTDGKSINDGWCSRLLDVGPCPDNDGLITVDTMDFSLWIRDVFENGKKYLNVEREIYCKMDIEGAEFAVLRKMLQDDTVKYIKHLWVEFHENLVPGESLKSKRELIKQLSQHTTVTQWH